MAIKIAYSVLLLSLVSSCSSKTHFGRAEPRIIPDFEITEFKKGCKIGVPLEYWFNDTASPSNRYLPSSPGCPKSSHGSRWVYYKESPSCFLANHQGPCKPGYVLKPRTGSFFGRCVCDCKENGNYFSRYESCGKDFNKRTRIYDKQTKRCYLNETEGTGQPCGKQEVIIGYSDRSIKCAPNCENTDDGIESGMCFQIKRQGCRYSVSVTSSIGQTQCPIGMTWKRMLRICAKDNLFYKPGIIG